MGPEPNPTICIGHGMGAHVCGMAGMTAKSRKKRPSQNSVMSFKSAPSNREHPESSMGLMDEQVRQLKFIKR